MILALMMSPDAPAYEPAAWLAAIVASAGMVMLCWMLALDEIRWLRRWRDLARQVAADKPAPVKPRPARLSRMEEAFARLPAYQVYRGPDLNTLAGGWVWSFCIGKNFGCREGDVAYRFWIEVTLRRAWWRQWLWGPFVDSAAWTGREVVRPCEVYALEPLRLPRIRWSFIR